MPDISKCSKCHREWLCRLKIALLEMIFGYENELNYVEYPSFCKYNNQGENDGN